MLRAVFNFIGRKFGTDKRTTPLYAVSIIKPSLLEVQDSCKAKIIYRNENIARWHEQQSLTVIGRKGLA